MEEVEKQVDDPVKDSQQEGSDDLLSRVSRFVKDGGSEEDNQIENSQEGQKENVGIHQDLRNQIAQIDDPDLREKYEALEKSLMSGANSKFQEIAEERKQLKALSEEVRQLKEMQSNGKWTPERIQSLMNDPEFLEAAKQITGEDVLEEDEYSSLTEQERQRVIRLEKELAEIKKQNEQATLAQQQAQIKAEREAQHSYFESKYANYDRKEIDIITQEMLENKIRPTTEHIYKAFKHDENVERAYELGRKDEREGVKDKAASLSASGINTNKSDPVIEPKEGETSLSFWNRLVEKNLEKTKRK